MLSEQADAFEDATSDEAGRREALVERARQLLDAQADALMEIDPAEDGPAAATDAHHAPHNPHRRSLSAAARRLIRAHEEVEEAAQD
jgi:hypothetical protein